MLDKFLINQNLLLRDALAKIEVNHFGMILCTNDDGAVIGMATDGDIRGYLLRGGSLDDKVVECTNSDFVWVNPDYTRELLLKLFETPRLRTIPVLNLDRRLVNIMNRDHLPVQNQEAVYARARAPARISFGGGGSDVTHHFVEADGAVINTTVSLYTHAALRIRNDQCVNVYSRDLGLSLEASDLADAMNQTGEFALVQAVFQAIKPEFGFDLYLDSEFPIGSGLGGSAVVVAAILGCFNELRRDRWDEHELSEIAFQAERLHLGIAGGWQDQYATVFGGLNFMEFRMHQNLVHPLRISPDTKSELEESLILCDTGLTHDSGAIHVDQREYMNSKSVQELVKANVELTYRLRDHLLRGRLIEFGTTMHEAWQLKRRFSPKISSPHLDSIYNSARAAGASGGKLVGAGGGGFFLFYVTPFRKHELIACLEDQGLSARHVQFDQDGLRSWTVRENKNHGY